MRDTHPAPDNVIALRPNARQPGGDHRTTEARPDEVHTPDVVIDELRDIEVTMMELSLAHPATAPDLHLICDLARAVRLDFEDANR